MIAFVSKTAGNAPPYYENVVDAAETLSLHIVLFGAEAEIDAF